MGALKYILAGVFVKVCQFCDLLEQVKNRL